MKFSVYKLLAPLSIAATLHCGGSPDPVRQNTFTSVINSGGAGSSLGSLADAAPEEPSYSEDGSSLVNLPGGKVHTGITLGNKGQASISDARDSSVTGNAKIAIPVNLERNSGWPLIFALRTYLEVPSDSGITNTSQMAIVVTAKDSAPSGPNFGGQKVTASTPILKQNFVRLETIDAKVYAAFTLFITPSTSANFVIGLYGSTVAAKLTESVAYSDFASPTNADSPPKFSSSSVTWSAKAPGFYFLRFIGKSAATGEFLDENDTYCGYSRRYIAKNSATSGTPEASAAYSYSINAGSGPALNLYDYTVRVCQTFHPDFIDYTASALGGLLAIYTSAAAGEAPDTLELEERSSAPGAVRVGLLAGHECGSALRLRNGDRLNVQGFGLQESSSTSSSTTTSSSGGSTSSSGGSSGGSSSGGSSGGSSGNGSNCL